MEYHDNELIDWSVFTETRSALGPNFIRLLGYFREDGTKSVMLIEDAMRGMNATKLIIPAHTLKGEASQFGAIKLAGVAEQIEVTARHCIEFHQQPDEILSLVVGLRPIFEETLTLLSQEASPVIKRQASGFGRAARF